MENSEKANEQILCEQIHVVGLLWAALIPLSHVTHLSVLVVVALAQQL